LLFGRPKDAIGLVFCEDRLDLAPESFVDDGLMLAGVAFVLVYCLTAINLILQHEIKRAAGKRLFAISSAVRCISRLADDTLRVEFGLE
jgi:hypothetical protein